MPIKANRRTEVLIIRHFAGKGRTKDELAVERVLSLCVCVCVCVCMCVFVCVCV